MYLRKVVVVGDQALHVCLQILVIRSDGLLLVLLPRRRHVRLHLHKAHRHHAHEPLVLLRALSVEAVELGGKEIKERKLNENKRKMIRKRKEIKEIKGK